MVTATSPALARDQFPALDTKVFLDAACVSLAPQAAVEAVSRFLHDAADCSARSATLHHLAMDATCDAARTEVSRLIRAEPDEIALVESTTHALGVVADHLPLREGDNILVGDLEFLQVPLAWRQRAHGASPDIRVVRHTNGELPPSAYAAQLDDRTRVVVVSATQWSNGYRCDLDELAAICSERGVTLVVDAIQQLGAFPIDVARTPVDIVVCGGHKWLNAPFGTGFLYVRRSSWSRLAPARSGYLALEPPEGSWSRYFQSPDADPFPPLAFVEGLRRYEHGGTSNYPGAVGLTASVAIVNRLGFDRIEAHVRDLTDRVIAGLQSLPVSLVTPLDPRHRSGIVTFGFESHVEREQALMEQLLDRDILVSLRYSSGVGGVRVSCHYFNSHDDIDRLLNAIDDCT